MAAMSDPPEAEEKREADRLIAQFEARKAGHDHEWTLLAGRMTAFLSAQSLFATGAALLISTDKTDRVPAVLFISIVACIIAFLSSISIAINCRVIRDWHWFMRDLIRTAEEKYSDPLKNPLHGRYIKRRQPDLFHAFSTDLFSVGISVVAGFAWLATIVTINVYPLRDLVPFISNENKVLIGILLGVIWASTIILIYRRSLIEVSSETKARERTHVSCT